MALKIKKPPRSTSLWFFGNSEFLKELKLHSEHTHFQNANAKCKMQKKKNVPEEEVGGKLVMT